MFAMADYYPLIRRAIAALETANFEGRRAVYNRARAVQSGQLHNHRFNKTASISTRLMASSNIRRVTPGAPAYAAPYAAPSAMAQPLYAYAPGYGYGYTPGYWNRGYWGYGYGWR
jgi:hypothetical protein